ncbi:MAG: NHL repeat-containing protein [Actinobacteria bacterium]|nr:NHL repeat-containing protein [Actinomycetota bacterium]
MQRVSLRKFLIAVLLILVMMTIALLYLYYVISRPLGAPTAQTKQMRHLFSIYGYGTKDEEMLLRPTDVAFDSERNIYIADTGHARVLVFSSSGQYLRKIGKKGFGRGELAEPVGVTVSKNGHVYVTDKTLSKVAIYDKDGEFKSEFKVMVPFKPHIANGRLYLTTYGHIMTYDLKGRLLTEWGQRGREKGDFDCPTGITVSKDGKVFVSDTLNLRLQAFSKSGEVLWVKGKPAKDIRASDRSFGLPCGIVIDERNLLYLVDAFDNSIKVLNTEGKQIAELGERGIKEGELNQPSSIAYDRNGIFAVADKFNDRVQVIKITVE